MKKRVFEEFDGYPDIVRAIEVSRTYAMNYTADRDTVEPHVHRLHPPRLRLRVADLIDETPSARTFRLVSEADYLPPFQAGQYVSLFFQIGNIRTGRPYSLSSPANQTGYYDITVRRVEGGLVSNYLLDDVRRGQILESSGPAGNFYHNPLFHDAAMVCIAGGSGITPFMSMIREIVQCGLRRTVHLFYGNKRLEEAIFHQELVALSERFENIRYTPVIENPPPGYHGDTGLITGELIQGKVGELGEKTFYLCGPQSMYTFCMGELANLGIPKRKIRREAYGAPVAIFCHPGWPAEIGHDRTFTITANGDRVLTARAGESLLTVLEKGGMGVPSGCRSGECSLCRVKILKGSVFQPEGVPVRRSDSQFGYVHACVSYPIQDLEVLI
jgi:ferredoxin-NADP reductase